jgi:PAS domain S-box-containing protein
MQDLFPLSLPLFEFLPDALLIVDANGTIVKANGNAHALFGYAPGELPGRPVEDLVPSDARGRHRAHREAYMAQPRMRPMGMGNMTLSGQRRDGRQFPVEIALSPVDAPTGVYYVASVRDISESQRVQQALVRARYDAVVARLGPLALAPDAGDRFIGMIPRLLADALEVPEVAVIVMEHDVPRRRAVVGEWDGVVPAWLLPEHGLLRRALAGEAVVMQAPGEPGGVEWPESVGSAAAVPLLDRGTAIGALVTVSPGAGRFDHDALQLLQAVANLLSTVLQRRHYEDELSHAQRLDAIGQLTGGVAHDFNNLLTVVSGSLQLLERECTERPEARDIIQGALRSVGRGAELTSKLLAFARRQHLSPSRVDPAEALEDLALMLRSTLGDGIEVRILPEKGLPATYADASQLDNALLNLALNSRDAMPNGGEIEIVASERWVMADPAYPQRKPGHYVEFRVRDTGQGMPPGVLARVFEPFFTTKGPRRGSGLGLSMVYGFVRQSGGFLEIQSRPGAGTTVTMCLPVAAERSDAQAAAPVRPAGAAACAGATILLVEDEDDVRKVASATLVQLGYRPLAVSGAREALAQLQRDDGIVLLFSDVMLRGGMDGLALAQEARLLRPRIGVLLASGYDPVSTRMAGGSGFELLRKPYRMEQLAEALARNLPAAEGG